ncbi:tyrosine-type recombinase/integrase [Phyllobacterium sp. SB3]|uniref:tyrosine-type recombinase/integrase n=1 Tax=Phyllobacterium sp. SB3 TaxID=3156073 RepID=UPI0032AEA6AF
MVMKTTMTQHVDAYLAERSMLGFNVGGPDARLLRSFASFADEQDRGTLTNDLVIHCVKDRSSIGNPFTWAGRLAVVKPFAVYMTRLDPATEFPETQIFGKSRRRLTPHIYTDDEILGLMAAARALEPQGALRPVVFEALIGLIAATGLRISEAINLRCCDVDLKANCLTVRMTKFCKSRHVPFHRSVANALASYVQIRERFVRLEHEQAFLTIAGGQSLNKRTVHGVFQRLRRSAGIVPRGSYSNVRIHDLRHTFICRRLERWQAEGCDIDNAIAALATYVGHAKVSDTYWYMTGIPDLMAIAGSRFEDFTSGEDIHV